MARRPVRDDGPEETEPDERGAEAGRVRGKGDRGGNTDGCTRSVYENMYTKNPRSETSRGSGRGRGKTQRDLGAVLKTEQKGEGRRKELAIGGKEKEQKDKVNEGPGRMEDMRQKKAEARELEGEMACLGKRHAGRKCYNSLSYPTLRVCTPLSRSASQ